MPHLNENQEAALRMALDSHLWFSDAKIKAQVVELMCNFSKQQSEGIRQAYEMVNDENAELKLQVEALTQALETQERENQPYIKELETRERTYRDALEHILLEMKYGRCSDRLPAEIFVVVAKIANERDICIITNPDVMGLSIYINTETAAGGVKPESK